MFQTIMFCILLAVGLFLILADCFHIPYIASSKAVKRLSKSQSQASALDVWLGSVATWLAKRIRLNEFKREALVIDLRAAQIDMSPEEFRAEAIVRASVIGVLAIPALFLHPLFCVLILIVAVFIYARENEKLSEKIRQKREAIEFELPKLVNTIEKTLVHSKNVLSILDNYRKNAEPALRDELTITVADMQSGNHETAITRLENRVGSPMLNEVCRGLVSMLRGDETTLYWANLNIKFSDYQRQQLRMKAQEVPDKLQRLSMCLLFAFIAVYLVVFVVEIIESMGILFG